MTTLGEVQNIITFDGKIHSFSTENRKILVFGGYGSPNIEFSSRKGYGQHGITIESYSLQPRTIGLKIWTDHACSRKEWWDIRSELLNIIRPNRNGPMSLTITLPDGSIRSIKCRANPGFEFLEPDDNSWHIQEPIELLCLNPVWTDPTPHTSINNTTSIEAELTFSIDFDIYFGDSGDAFSSGSVVYEGTWLSITDIILTGPYTRAYMYNPLSGAYIFMNVPIAAGDSRILHIEEGNILIYSPDNSNRFNELGPGTNLRNFGLIPSSSPQEIRVIMVDKTVDSGATITYYNRYLGI